MRASKNTVQMMIRKRRYSVPFSKKVDPTGQLRGRVVMVTNNPADPAGVLVWREGSLKPGKVFITAFAAKLGKTKINESPPEKMATLDLAFDKTGREMNVFHLVLDPAIRRKGFGTAIREMMIQRARRGGHESIRFPTSESHPDQFYAERGFDSRHSANIGDLDYTRRPGLVDWGKQLEEKGFRIYWAKSSAHGKDLKSKK